MRKLERGFGSKALLGWTMLGSALGCQPEPIQQGNFDFCLTRPVVSVRGGEALVAWRRENSDLYVSSAFSDAPWSAPVVVAQGDDPEVALSSSGKAFMIYQAITPDEYYSTRALVRSGGVWSAPFVLDHDDDAGRAVDIATDAAGNALAVWSGGVGVPMRARLYHPATGWKPKANINPGGGSGIVKAAMNESGTGAVAWCDGGRLFAARYDPNSGWGAPFGAPPSNCCAALTDGNAPGVSVAIAETGSVFAVGASWANACTISRPAGSGWSWAVLDSQGNFGSPQVTASVDGHALVAWVRTPNGGGTRILKARAYAPANGWGPVLTGPSGVWISQLGLGYGSDGSAAIALGLSKRIAMVSYSQQSGTLGAPWLSSTDGSQETTPYMVSTDADPLQPQQGVTVWHQGGHEEIWGARLGI
jgi:hypothetical protein